MSGFTCSDSGRMYLYERNLTRHVNESHAPNLPLSPVISAGNRLEDLEI